MVFGVPGAMLLVLELQLLNEFPVLDLDWARFKIHFEYDRRPVSEGM
jgi:hypothetical protein